jgi:alpha-ribazole phosphatase
MDDRGGHRVMSDSGDVFTAAPAGVGLRLVLIRHGETEASVQGRCAGTLDSPLTDRGHAQMRSAARYLKTQPTAALYASPRQRAMDSARVLTRGDTAPPVSIDSRLSEIDFGVLEGLTYDEVAARHPTVWQAWMGTPTDVTFPGGESFAAFSARVDDFMRHLRQQDHERAVTVVAHGGVNRVVLARALGLDLQHMFRLQQTYGGISIIDFYDDTAIVQVMNATGGAR